MSLWLYVWTVKHDANTFSQFSFHVLWDMEGKLHQWVKEGKKANDRTTFRFNLYIYSISYREFKILVFHVMIFKHLWGGGGSTG